MQVREYLGESCEWCDDLTLQKLIARIYAGPTAQEKANPEKLGWIYIYRQVAHGFIYEDGCWLRAVAPLHY